MGWTQTIAIITLTAFIFWLFTKLDNDIKDLCSRQDAQTQRIDQLYQMFVELLKERR